MIRLVLTKSYASKRMFLKREMAGNLERIQKNGKNLAIGSTRELAV